MESAGTMRVRRSSGTRPSKVAASASVPMSISAGTARIDWKPVRHFGVTGGYNVLYLKVTDTVAGRTVIVKPMVHGPLVGIGFYF